MLKYLPEERITAEQAMKHKYFDDVRNDHEFLKLLEEEHNKK